MDLLLNRVFTKSNLDKIISTGESTVLKKSIEKYSDKEVVISNIDGFKEIYKYMSKSYRNEYFYKNQLLNKLLIGRHSLNTTSALRELPIENSISDFVLINGKAQVYEIKTELDNLKRLSNQINDYYKAFKYVNVITDESHVENIMETLPNKNIGIFVLTKRNTISTIREPSEYGNKLNHVTMFKTLRKKEYLSILEDYFGQKPEVSDFEMYDTSLKLFEEIPINKAHDLMKKKLKERYLDTFRENKNIVLETPSELRELIYFSNYNQDQLTQLKLKLNNPVNS